MGRALVGISPCPVALCRLLAMVCAAAIAVARATLSEKAALSRGEAIRNCTVSRDGGRRVCQLRRERAVIRIFIVPVGQKTKMREKAVFLSLALVKKMETLAVSFNFAVVNVRAILQEVCGGVRVLIKITGTAKDGVGFQPNRGGLLV